MSLSAADPGAMLRAHEDPSCDAGRRRSAPCRSRRRDRRASCGPGPTRTASPTSRTSRLQGAKKIAAHRLRARRRPRRAGSPRPLLPPRAAATLPANYRSIEISSPRQSDSFFGADAVVNVAVRDSIRRSRPDHRVAVFLNGRPVQGASNSLEYTLTGLPRGTHSLCGGDPGRAGHRADLAARPRTFHVRQPSDQPAGGRRSRAAAQAHAAAGTAPERARRLTASRPPRRHRVA